MSENSEPSGGDTFLLVYVYDILVLRTPNEDVKFSVGTLKLFYDVRNCDSVYCFLDFQIDCRRHSDGCPKSRVMFQALHAPGLLRRLGMENSKPVPTKMHVSF